MDEYWTKPRERKQETGAKREDADLDIEKTESTGE